MSYHTYATAQVPSAEPVEILSWDDMIFDDATDLDPFHVDSYGIVQTYFHAVKTHRTSPQTAINDLVAFGMATEAVIREIRSLAARA